MILSVLFVQFKDSFLFDVVIIWKCHQHCQWGREREGERGRRANVANILSSPGRLFPLPLQEVNDTKSVAGNLLQINILRDWHENWKISTRLLKSYPIIILIKVIIIFSGIDQSSGGR